MSIRILVAEDDENIRNLIVRYLEKEGYCVFPASDGETAMEKWFESAPDIVILDVMMPKMDGWEVLRQIREQSGMPVIMLTAKREESDRLKGFRLGTDDYVIKPFSPGELVMRVKALLKRSGMLSQSYEIVFPGLKVNSASREVETPEGKANLSNREFELLLYLIDNRGIALSREKLIERIWGYGYDGDERVLDTTVKRLRGKLGASGSFIKTLRGTGYKFEENK